MTTPSPVIGAAIPVLRMIDEHASRAFHVEFLGCEIALARRLSARSGPGDVELTAPRGRASRRTSRSKTRQATGALGSMLRA